MEKLGSRAFRLKGEEALRLIQQKFDEFHLITTSPEVIADIGDGKTATRTIIFINDQAAGGFQNLCQSIAPSIKSTK